MAWEDLTKPANGWKVTKINAADLDLTTSSILNFFDTGSKPLKTHTGMGSATDWSLNCDHEVATAAAGVGVTDLIKVEHEHAGTTTGYTIQRVVLLRCFKDGGGGSDPVWEAQEG